MKKLIAIIVIALVIIGGAYWISGMMKAKPNLSGGTTVDTPSSTATGTTISHLKGVSKGPFIILENSSGEYLADKNGQTLYITTKDQSNASGKIVVSCDAKCETVWPPYLLSPSEPAPDTSNDPLLSKLNLYKRPDGRYQFALGTALLYTYVKDVSRGSTQGTSITGWVLARP
jgi:predicted lipoprotein with Yx(FWY)xxD motif